MSEGINLNQIEGGVSPTGAYQFGDVYEAIVNHPAFSGPTVLIGCNDTTGKGAKLVIASDSNDANDPGINFYSSKGNIETPLTNNNGNGLGASSFYGFDGTDFCASSQIFALVSAAPTAGHVPGRVGISCEDGSSMVTMLDLNGADKKAIINAPNGVIQSAPATTPAALLANGQVSFYLDEVGNKLMVAVKYSDGTAKTGEVALT